MIYIDNPVGPGYSFSDGAGYSNNEIEAGQNLMVENMCQPWDMPFTKTVNVRRTIQRSRKSI